ncbi:MAG: (4Fe-4S)-binding protein [candidate division Zixibacteria bacterium SM1_73]|nr:MAG: (4Fe-4S)-binding protein [candidate division Zixibacteria bacterium SM1_73]
MIISVASGKGGTGKTTIATSLALLLSEERSQKIQFLDCDVEEPNAYIFLKPQIKKTQPVNILVPQVDKRKCNFCGECAKVCVYNAIVVLKREVLVFPELCHGCGGCSLLCPEDAITEAERKMGVIEEGQVRRIQIRTGPIRFIQGRLNIGEPMATPLIRAIKKKINPDGVTIIDVPPGTSCPVIEAVHRSDFCILVTEPTPFGLNDLKLAVEVMRKLRIDCGVVINRANIGDDRVKEYCHRESIQIMAEIPYDRNVAVLYSSGIPMLIEGEKYRKIFSQLWASIERRVG